MAGALEYTTRDALSELIGGSFLKSVTPKRPVRIAFPLDCRERLFPNLFTDVELVVLPPPARPVL